MSSQLDGVKEHNIDLGICPTCPEHVSRFGQGRDDDDSVTNITVATAIAAAATGTTAESSLGQSTSAGSVHPGLLAAINRSIMPAFNQVMQNQSVLQSQIPAMSLARPPPVQAPPAFIVPPVQQLAFLMQQPFQLPMQQQQYQQAAGYGQGQQGMFQGGHGGQGGRGHSRGGSHGTHQRHHDFVSMICNQADMGPYQGQQGMFAPCNLFGGMGPFVPQAPAKNNNNVLSKRFANLNTCFSCGFDVAEGHTSATCPFGWHKPNH